MLHHCQLTFYEQAFRPVPQENLSSFCGTGILPVADNNARYQYEATFFGTYKTHPPRAYRNSELFNSSLY
jgi:hypothetical protein